MRTGLAWLILAIACGAAPADRAPRAQSPTADADSTRAPVDSLVARGSGGQEIWWTLAREDRSADGARCTDRTMEIRRGASHVAVPLLYTEETPHFVDDSTVAAVLYRGCRPIARYRVDARTGQPTPMRP